jgi:serine/threonine protein kinase
MSAEPRQNTNTDVWTQWEGKVVNGVYPLRRFLGGSGHNGVFLTEQTAENRPSVAIKFVPADAVDAEAQLVQWGATTTLLHPNLVRIFDVGRYRFEGREYLYVVTEYADQTLAEILPRRPLAPDEVKELLLPTLDTLLFLHRRGLIHGRLKPSNFLAVNDRLKLSSDTIRPINHTASGSARTSAYDPPELKDRGMNAAGDIWGLGMTLLEALTQRTTAWPDETVSLPADLPAPFANTLLRCLSVAPGVRPNVLDLDAQYNPAAQVLVPPTPAAQPSARQAAPKVTAPQSARKPQSWRRILSIVLSVALLAWIAIDLLRSDPEPAPPAAPPPAPVAPATTAKTPEPMIPAATPQQPAAASTTTPSGDVLHEAKPELPRSVLTKIKGRVHVTVRVLVDQDGAVVGTMLENAGPSKYFAQLAEQSAADWKFAPAATQETRVWLILFVFSRNGVNTRAMAQ